MKKIGLLIISTNKYIQFLPNLIESADKFFNKNNDVTYFIFSDKNVEINTFRKVVLTEVEHKPWPWMTLGRYEIFTQNFNKLKDMDYLFYSDVDMLFVSDVGDEILSDRVATEHPSFNGGRGTPETNPISKAFVSHDEPLKYFAGGFNGGKSTEFLKMSEIISSNIKIDLEKGYIAIWHDESHMNRYFLDFPPTKILTPSYCYPESYSLPFEKKLLALNKNHGEIRS